MKNIAIIGFGGLAKEVYYQIIQTTPDVNVTFFVDEQYLPRSSRANGGFKIESLDDYRKKYHNYVTYVCLGDSKKRKEIVNSLPSDVFYGIFIHKSVNFLNEYNIGVGTIILSNCIISNNVTIGDFCILNLATTVGHDTKIADFVSTMPQVSISGNVSVGSDVYIGTNASIRDGVCIEGGITIGMQSAVVKDISNNAQGSAVYAGVPAKMINK